MLLSPTSPRFAGPAPTPARSTSSATWPDAAKLCLGYSNDPRVYADRVRRSDEVVSRDGRLIDAEGLTVEDFGLTDNLMMIHALDIHGCALVMPPHAPADMWHDLTAFETCVRLAAERLAASD